MNIKKGNVVVINTEGVSQTVQVTYADYDKVTKKWDIEGINTKTGRTLRWKQRYDGGTVRLAK